MLHDFLTKNQEEILALTVRDFIERDHPISSEWDHFGGASRSVSDGYYLRVAALSTFLAASAR